MSKLFWSGLMTLVLLSGCGWNGTPSRQNDFVPLTSMAVTAEYPTIAVGTSTKLTVIGNYSGLFTRDITDQVVWSSDTPAVTEFITTVSPGRVRGSSTGNAKLTASLSGVTGTCALTVSNATATSLAVTPVNQSIPKGLTAQYKVIGTFSDTSTQDLTFDASWVSGTPAVASINDAPAGKGFATAISVGTTQITATFPVGGNSGSTTLTVTAAALKSIAVTPANPSILSLSSVGFTATGTYTDNSSADITSQVAWTSSSPGVATFGTGSVASTLTQGTTSISAALPGTPGVSGTTNLKVTGGTLTGFTLSAANLTLVKGTQARITANGNFSNGTTRDITGLVSWSTGNSSLATVSAPIGNLVWINAVAVTPVTTVTATSGSLSATANLTVTAPVLSTITISPVRMDLTAGTSARFTVTANFIDGSSQDVTASSTWTSGSSAVATVGDSGLAKGRVIGGSANTTDILISAVYGGLPAITAPVKVTQRTLQSLAIFGSPTVASGNKAIFATTANFSDGTSVSVTDDTTWTIDNPFVAVLADSTNQPGQVVGVDRGTATLTANFGGSGGKTATATITVQ